MFGRVKSPKQSNGPQVVKPSVPSPPDGAAPASPAPPRPSKPAGPTGPRFSRDRINEFYELKTRVHRKLVDRLDLTKMVDDDQTLREQVREVVRPHLAALLRSPNRT